jgi:3-deoxy-D-manno-octulosonate 8-phosphate phosphatase (KDO 8-P phosphatase)
MRLVGISVAVADAVPEVRRAATYVTRAKPGHGAIRELCDLILAAHHPRRK